MLLSAAARPQRRSLPGRLVFVEPLWGLRKRDQSRLGVAVAGVFEGWASRYE